MTIEGGAMEGDGNLARLQEASIIAEGDLPEELREVISGLTDEEVEILVKVKKRLDAADIAEDAIRPPKERQKGYWELWMVF
jgi:hypothetical protein